MFGTVAADGSEPVLPLSLLSEVVEAVIDTGFDGELTLQEATIRRLGYPYSGSAGGTLADGSEVQVDFYEGRVLWHGADRPVAVIGAEGQPLIGMGLLEGSRLTLEAEPGGKVLVEELAGEQRS
jgi:clan AA aspartic protease